MENSIQDLGGSLKRDLTRKEQIMELVEQKKNSQRVERGVVQDFRWVIEK
jgi:hypothetical protein